MADRLIHVALGRRLSLFFAVVLAAAVSTAAAQAASPGAASTARFGYNDAGYRGWPVAPTNVQHPVRAGFLDPRHGGYHAGVDIGVRDDRPDEGAPDGETHRVYAVDGGFVSYDATTAEKPCAARVVSVGHFSYGHVDPVGVVEEGAAVAPGQQIGWTCAGQWHMHLTEWQTVNGQSVRVNPLRPDGKLWPYADTLAPVIRDVRFFALPDPAVVRLMPWTDDGAVPADPDLLSGVVDVRAWISDPQSFGGWYSAPEFSRLRSEIAPYRMHVTVTRVGSRAPTIDRDVFRGDISLGFSVPPWTPLPFGTLYAPGTSLTLAAQPCLDAQAGECQGAFWYRVFASPVSPYWDTALYPNGRYRIDISAWDVAGNGVSTRVFVRTANLSGRARKAA